MEFDKLKYGIIIKCHLPFYKNEHQQYILPFAKLHIIRDFHNLVQLLKSNPDFPATICITPSTLLQMKEYVSGKAHDIYWELAIKDPLTMDPVQKNELLKSFFSFEGADELSNWPGFLNLFAKYKKIMTKSQGDEFVASAFSESDFRDLQVWFLLSWFGQFAQQKSEIAALLKKDNGFDENDKKILQGLIHDLITEVYLFFKDMNSHKNLRLIYTPFYHPIMPIIYNSDVVREVNRGLDDVPVIHLSEDADWHIKNARKFIERNIRKGCKGIIFPEGAVSDDVIKLIARNGFEFTMINEIIVKNTLHGEYNPINHLYTPLLFNSRNGKNVLLYVIDGELDDKINMVYPTMDTEQALLDFERHLQAIRSRLISSTDDLSSHLVTINLNLESIWSNYPEHGVPFLSRLFSLNKTNQDIEPVLHQKFKSDKRKLKKLNTIHPNTKFNDRFQLWIGNEEDNIAWNYLLEARQFLKEQAEQGTFGKTVISRAWEQIHIAQSSDWWWWFGEENYGRYEMDFDTLFRGHLMHVFELFEQEIPEKYFQPIKWRHFSPLQSIQPKGAVKPVIDGTAKPASEWKNAVKYNCTTKESILKEGTTFKNIYIGYNKKYLFLRIDFTKKPHILCDILISIYTDKKTVVIISPLRGTVLFIKNSEAEPQLSDMEYLQPHFAYKDIFEMKLPIKKLKLPDETNIKLQFSLKLRREEIARFPYLNMIDLYLPAEEMR